MTSMTKAKKAYRRRAARRARLAEVWNQPKPGGWFSRLLGMATKGKLK